MDLYKQQLGSELYLACGQHGDVWRVRELLKIGADVNWKNSDMWTVLYRACVCNRSDIVKELLKYNPKLNQQTISTDRTAIHAACSNGSLDCVKLLLATGQCDLGVVDKRGLTPLGWAVVGNNLNIVKYLITEHGVDVNAPVTKFGDTMLELAFREGQLDIIKYLVTECSVSVNAPVTKSGDTMLGLAVHLGKLNIIKYLVTECSVSVNAPVTKSGDTLLGLAVREGQLKVIKYLVTECSVSVNGPVTKSGDTMLGLAVREGQLKVIKYLVTECSVSVNELHLFLACEHQQVNIVQYLLTTHHFNPNAKDDHQQTPLSLAKNKDIIKLLIQHGADAENVYALHRKVLNNVFSKDPIKNPVKMFVIGHGGEGKSTLIEAMEHEPTAWTSLVNVFIAPKEVEGVDQRTAGIIPRKFKSRYYGQVILYDFAGQEAYYSSHAAIIKSTVHTCPPVFLLVIGLKRDDTSITQSISYWLGIITNQCGNMEGKAPLIVVGSHADLVETGEADHKILIIKQAVKNYTTFDLVDVIAMDCRYSNSDGMKILRRCVETSCNSLRSKLSVSLNSHMFLIYLIEKHSSKLAVSLEKVQTVLEAGIDQNILKKHKELVPFIPTTIPRLVEICVQLSDKGHILFLLNEASPEKSFIIIDRTALLAEINGTMFAPEDFKQHCKLATSTGVVPRSKLTEHFEQFNTTMLVRFLTHLELAVPIEDPVVLNLINKHLSSTKNLAKSVDKEYLFCPALIRLEVPSKVFSYQDKLSFHFGWILSVEKAEHFLDARFLHVLLLRLAFSLGLAPEVDPDIPALQRQCSVWKTGVYWNTPQGAEVHVEVVAKKNAVVLIQSKLVSFELLKLRSKVIQKVREAASELCPFVATKEFLVSPSGMTYPLTISSLPLFSLKSVANSIVQQHPFVVSVDGAHQLQVDEYEVYAHLGERMLQTLFNSAQDEVVSDKVLSNLCSCWSKHASRDIVKNSLAESTTQSSEENLLVIFKSWRDGSDGTYRSLRRVLDRLSLFAGKNPLELAVQCRDIDENMAPALGLTISEPSSKVGLQVSTDDSDSECTVSDTHMGTKEITGAGLKDSDGTLKQVFESTAHKHLNTGLNTPLNVTDHLRPLTNVLWDVRPRWYNFGIQLNIDQPTLEVIRFDCRDSDSSFRSVLTHFLKRDRPSPTFSDLVTALQSPPVDQPQLVDRIMELASKESTGDCAEHSDIPSPLLQQNTSDSAVILVESTHLQRVKNLIWEVRVQWRSLAGALGVSHDTVEEIRHDLQCRNDGDRLEVVLTEWMRGGTATVHDLLTALSHHTVNGGHVSRQLRALQGEARLVLGLCETDCSLCLS